MNPGSIVSADLARRQQHTVADPGRAHAEYSLVAEAARSDLSKRFIDTVDQADMEIAGRRKITLIGKVRALSDIEDVDGLRHQPIKVRIALTMGMGAHVDRHIVDPDRQIGAMIEIIAAQEILIGFALAAVLRDDQSGHGLQKFSGAAHWARIQLLAGHAGLAGHFRLADRSRTDIGCAGAGCRRLGCIDNGSLSRR